MLDEPLELEVCCFDHGSECYSGFLMVDASCYKNSEGDDHNTRYFLDTEFDNIRFVDVLRHTEDGGEAPVEDLELLGALSVAVFHAYGDKLIEMAEEKYYDPD